MELAAGDASVFVRVHRRQRGPRRFGVEIEFGGVALKCAEGHRVGVARGSALGRSLGPHAREARSAREVEEEGVPRGGALHEPRDRAHEILSRGLTRVVSVVDQHPRAVRVVEAALAEGVVRPPHVALAALQPRRPADGGVVDADEDRAPRAGVARERVHDDRGVVREVERARAREVGRVRAPEVLEGVAHHAQKREPRPAARRGPSVRAHGAAQRAHRRVRAHPAVAPRLVVILVRRDATRLRRSRGRSPGRHASRDATGRHERHVRLAHRSPEGARPPVGRERSAAEEMKR